MFHPSIDMRLAATLALAVLTAGLLVARADASQATSPAAHSDVSSASGLEQECVEAVTTAPLPFEITRTIRPHWVSPVHGYQFVFRSAVNVGVPQLPEACLGSFRATGSILARYKDSEHGGWWLTAGGGVSYQRPQRGSTWLESFVLSDNEEVGCLQAVRLSLRVKVLDLSNGAKAADRVFRRPAQALTCSGQPKGRAPAESSARPQYARPLADAGLEAECIEVATAMPTGHQTTLRFRAEEPRGSYKREHWVTRFFLPAMPAECPGTVSRSLSINIQIQDPENPSRWHPMYKRKRGWLFFSNDFDAEWGGRGWRNNGERSHLLPGVYECGLASYEAGARVLLKARAHTPGPGQPVIAQRTYEVPVKVTGAC